MPWSCRTVNEKRCKPCRGRRPRRIGEFSGRKSLLLASDGVADMRIAAQVGVKPATVRAWRDRFAEEGLAKLGKVRAGRGRKSTIPQQKIDEIVHLTRHSTSDGQTHWSCPNHSYGPPPPKTSSPRSPADASHSKQSTNDETHH
jgi:hypothetical protein